MIYLRKLSCRDGIDVFNMLKGIKPIENSYTNPTFDMTFNQFQEWLIQQEQWEHGLMLPEGYVPQTVYWLFDDEIPVGVGKIRHSLTPASRITGGNIGYAVCSPYRGKGYGKILLKLLLEESKKKGIEEILVTIDKGNYPSRNVCLENGGQLLDENEERWYYTFKNYS